VKELTYHILEDSRELLCIVPDPLCTRGITDYFESLLNEKSAPLHMTEHVDFTDCHHFDVDYSSTGLVNQIYSRLVEKQMIDKLIFYVQSPLQHGMARMLSGVVAETGIEYDIVDNRTELDRLYARIQAKLMHQPALKKED
jgi:hypothetical protein